MDDFATRNRAVKALEARGFTYERPDVMGAAPFRRGAAYAWIEHEWSRKHCSMRYFVQARG